MRLDWHQTNDPLIVFKLNIVREHLLSETKFFQLEDSLNTFLLYTLGSLYKLLEELNLQLWEQMTKSKGNFGATDLLFFQDFYFLSWQI